MTTSEKDKWEIRLGIIGAIFTGLSIFVSVFIYLHGNKTAIQKEHELIAIQHTIDYQRQLWDETRTTYRKLATTLGVMAAELDQNKKVSAASEKAFNAAYWGALILIEDPAVQREMVRLRNDLRDLKAGRIDEDKIKLRVERILSLARQHVFKGIPSNETVSQKP